MLRLYNYVIFLCSRSQVTEYVEEMTSLFIGVPLVLKAIITCMTDTTASQQLGC